MNQPKSTQTPIVVNSREQLRAALAELRADDKSIGLVPTMGALHAGHLSLVAESNRVCDATVVTIFVNPSQFEPGEDFEQYPRTLESDLAALAEYNVDLVFAPPADEMYRPGHLTRVEVDQITNELEGRYRPNHFSGVATIVLKLFLLAEADVAFFGQKDYQQSLVIRRMAADLELRTEVRVCPTVREPDGLAMSSRNAYLSKEHRAQAVSVSAALRLAAKLIADGHREAGDIVRQMRQSIFASGVTHIDYVALVEPDTLEPVTEIQGTTLAAIAVQVGTTRLIDNELLDV